MKWCRRTNCCPWIEIPSDCKNPAVVRTSQRQSHGAADNSGTSLVYSLDVNFAANTHNGKLSEITAENWAVARGFSSLPFERPSSLMFMFTPLSPLVSTWAACPLCTFPVTAPQQSTEP